MQVFIAILVCALFLSSPAWGQGKRELDKALQKKKGDLTEVEKKLLEKKKEVKKKSWEEKRITDALDKSERLLDRKKKELRDLDAEARALEQNVARREEEIARLETSLAALGDMFQSRGRAMYKLHRAEVEAKKGEVEQEMRKKATLLAAVQKERAASERDVADLKEREKALRSLIQELTVKAAALKTTTTGFKTMRGKLPPPVQGNIFSPKGREHGIGIEAPEGAQIQAIFNGRVAYAAWFKGYGNLLVIDHGDGYHSVAAHASRLLKKVGDEVDRKST